MVNKNKMCKPPYVKILQKCKEISLEIEREYFESLADDPKKLKNNLQISLNKIVSAYNNSFNQFMGLQNFIVVQFQITNFRKLIPIVDNAEQQNILQQEVNNAVSACNRQVSFPFIFSEVAHQAFKNAIRMLQGVINNLPVAHVERARPSSQGLFAHSIINQGAEVPPAESQQIGLGS